MKNLATVFVLISLAIFSEWVTANPFEEYPQAFQKPLYGIAAASFHEPSPTVRVEGLVQGLYAHGYPAVYFSEAEAGAAALDKTYTDVWGRVVTNPGVVEQVRRLLAHEYCHDYLHVGIHNGVWDDEGRAASIDALYDIDNLLAERGCDNTVVLVERGPSMSGGVPVFKVWMAPGYQAFMEEYEATALALGMHVVDPWMAYQGSGQYVPELGICEYHPDAQSARYAVGYLDAVLKVIEYCKNREDCYVPDLRDGWASPSFPEGYETPPVTCPTPR